MLRWISVDYSVTVKGSGLLELLVSLVIATPLIFALLSTIQSASRQVSRVRSLVDHATIQSHVTLLARGLREDLDSSPLDIGLQIQEAGALSSAWSSISVKSGSSVVTSLKFDSDQLLEVEAEHGDENFINIRACTKNGALTVDETVHSFLGVGLLSLRELVPVSINITGNCLTGMFSFNGSFTNFLPPSIGDHVFSLLPIISHYSLFLDDEGTVRYLSHAGQNIIENQPLFHGIDGFTVEGDRTHFRITALINPQLTFSAEEAPRLARTSAFNLVLRK